MKFNFKTPTTVREEYLYAPFREFRFNREKRRRLAKKIKIVQAKTGMGKTHGMVNIFIPDIFKQDVLQDVSFVVIAVPNLENIDTITFQEAAKSFSDEKATKNNGGVLINPTTGDTRFELTKIDPVLYNQIQRLNDNEVSAPLLESDRQGNQSYKIIKVSNRFDEHTADYSQDYIKIKELALKEKQLNAIQKWMNEKIIDTYISVNDDSRDCNFTNKWLKN